MKIIHLISTLNIGGAENFLVQLANQQVVNNQVVIIVLGVTDSDKNYLDLIDDFIVIHQLQWQKKYSGIQFFKLNTLIGQLKPDSLFVHLHNPLYYTYLVSMLQPKIKYIHTIHSSFENWKPVLKYLNRFRFINNKILHVCVAKSIHEKLKNEFPKLKSTFINNGIKSYQSFRKEIQVKSFWDSFTIKPEIGKRFLAIGNINKHKNYRMLAHSFSSIYNLYPNAMCIHIGDEMDIMLSQELKKINAPNLFFAGSKPYAADFLIQADALVVSSIQEGMPMAVLEALSMGIPVITTPAGGLKDVILNDVNGFLISDFEETSLTAAIKKFIELSTNEQAKLGANARVHFEQHYDINSISKIYQNKSA